MKQFIINFIYRVFKTIKVVIPSKIRNRFPYKGIMTIATQYGGFKMKGTGKGIENVLFWEGIKGYEFATIEPFMDVCVKAKTVFDVGANTGLFSLLAKLVNESCEVHSFEPLPAFKKLIDTNSKLNNWEIITHEKAVSNYSGKASFFLPAANKGNIYSSSLSLKHYYAHQNTKPVQVEVEVITLDNIIDGLSIGNIDVIKIDAEGMDYEVMLGMKRHIPIMLPIFLVEIQSREVAARISEYLDQWNYLYYCFSGNKTVNILEIPYEKNCLNYFCIPRSKQQTLPKIFFN